MNFDIEAIKRKMLVKYPFFGSVIANVEYSETKEIETAATDGKVIYYNPVFMDQLNNSEQIFIFAHEVCHIAFNHILRSDGKEPKIWNTATDAVINAFLKRDGLNMVEGVVDIENAINYDAEHLYNELLKKKQKQNGKENLRKNSNSQGSSSQSQGSNEQTGESKQGNQSSNPNHPNENQQGSNLFQKDDSNGKEKNHDVGHDTHSMWDDAVKKAKEKKGNKDKSTDTGNQEKKQREIEQKQKDLENIGERDAFKKNLEEKKKELEQLKKELTRQAIGAGSSMNSNIRNITDIGKSKPLIDWRYVLKEAVKYDVDWSYQHATIENGVISANLEEQPIPETEIVLDTSGSINEILLKNFLRECKNILKHSRLKVGCFDTKFYGFNEIRTEKDIENMKFVGGGGTNFSVAVNAFTRRVENKIIFTDGEALMPNTSLDAIWIVFGRTRINPNGGKVIYITGEQLNRLYSFEQNNLSKVRHI